MLQKHSCWPWVGPTLQVLQPGQVPSDPAGFVPFLMPLLYLSYIHSVTPPLVPSDPPIDSPTSPLTARATETNASSQQLCVPPAQSSIRHFHVPHSSLPLHYLDSVTPNLRCHCTSCISWLSLAHDLHKLLTNPPSVFLLPVQLPISESLMVSLTYIHNFSYFSTAVLDYDAHWPLSHTRYLLHHQFLFLESLPQTSGHDTCRNLSITGLQRGSHFPQQFFLLSADSGENPERGLTWTACFQGLSTL